MKDIKNHFHKIPKADVHNHFHLGSSQKKIIKAYPNVNIEFPKSYDGLNGMVNFIYGSLNTIMVSKEDVIKFMELSIESNIDDNVTYLEASVDVNLARFFNDSIEEVIEVVKNLKETYKTQIDFKPEIGINKDLPIDKVYLYSEACMDSGIFEGIDLYGKEADQNLKPFEELFESAKKNRLKTKVHIGEFSDSKSIEKTIYSLNPDEIQHGINAVNSTKVMDLILERDIRLNICPKSNIYLGAVKNLKTHPIRTLFDKEIRVTVNTDDLILFNSTVSQELIDLVDNKVFSFDEAETIRQNAF